MKNFNFYCDSILKWDHNGKTYMVYIQEDDMPDSPRNWDNASTMACFHRRYNLGDKITEREPEEFWQNLVRDNVPEKEIFAAAQSGKLTGIRLAKNEENQGLFDIYETIYWRTPFGNSEPDETLDYEGVPKDAVAQYLMNDLTINHCMTLMEPYAEWMPLWLYDHSGISISAGRRVGQYADQWDSGQLGWIIITKKRAFSEFMATEDSWRERAIKCMEADVDIYEKYLDGEVYGYQLFEQVDDEWEEVDSCWGYYGSDIAESGLLDECPGLQQALETDAFEEGELRTRVEKYYVFAA